MTSRGRENESGRERTGGGETSRGRKLREFYVSYEESWGNVRLSAGINTDPEAEPMVEHPPRKINSSAQASVRPWLTARESRVGEICSFAFR